VRELVTELADAARTARAAGAQRVEEVHLAADAGQALPPSSNDPTTAAVLDDTGVDAALAKHGGNISAAARELSVHRTQLRRFLARRTPRA
jgi:ActR/RegA family two-component response regulator